MTNWQLQNPCMECEGKGQSIQRRQVSFKIPAGTNDKETVQFRIGKVELLSMFQYRLVFCRNYRCFKDEVINLKFFQQVLYITFNVAPSTKFRREKDDIHCDVEITMAQAVLGGTVQVEIWRRLYFS